MTDPTNAALAEAIELLEVGLQHPATMFYTRPYELAAATRTIISALRQQPEQAREGTKILCWTHEIRDPDCAVCRKEAVAFNMAHRALSAQPAPQYEELCANCGFPYGGDVVEIPPASAQPAPGVGEEERLREALRQIWELAENCPELNMSNYYHSEVGEINAAMIEVWQLSKDAIAALQPKGEG